MQIGDKVRGVYDGRLPGVVFIPIYFYPPFTCRAALTTARCVYRPAVSYTIANYVRKVHAASACLIDPKESSEIRVFQI